MNDFVWYSRLVVWAGAVVLLAQAIAGKGSSFMTLFAVVCLVIGFPLFLAGLALFPDAPAAAGSLEAPPMPPGPPADAQAHVTSSEQVAHRTGEDEASLPEVVLEPVEGERDRPLDLGPAADERE